MDDPFIIQNQPQIEKTNDLTQTRQKPKARYPELTTINK